MNCYVSSLWNIFLVGQRNREVDFSKEEVDMTRGLLTDSAVSHVHTVFVNHCLCTIYYLTDLKWTRPVVYFDLFRC